MWLQECRTGPGVDEAAVCVTLYANELELIFLISGGFSESEGEGEATATGPEHGGDVESGQSCLRYHRA